MSQPFALIPGVVTPHGSAWERAAAYEKQERPMRPVGTIVLACTVDVVFFRASMAHLVVAAETHAGIAGVRTRFDGNTETLIIEQEGVATSGVHV